MSHQPTRRFAVLWAALSILPLALAPARAELFRVGPGGSHSTIQAALDAALAAPGDHEVRVAAGTWVERLTVFAESGPPRRIRVSGGWSAPGFVARDADPALTVVSAAGAGRPLYLACSTGTISFSGFTFRDGLVDEDTGDGTFGGGVVVAAWNGGGVTLSGNAMVHNRVVDRVANPTEGVIGGGLAVAAWDGGRVEVRENVAEENEVFGLLGAGAGGAHFSLGPGGVVSATGNRFERNRVTAAHANGAGVVLDFYASGGSAVFADNRVRDNVALAPTVVHSGAQFSGWGESGTVLSVLRNDFSNNAGAGPSPFQVGVHARGAGTVVVSDSLFANSGDAGGIALLAEAGAHLQATNLTVGGNAGPGIEAGAEAGGSVRIWNSISFGNGGSDRFGPGAEVRAHFTADPFFFAPERGDFHLRLDSFAIDAGRPDPPGGLGAADLDLGPRVRGAAVDAGAYETDRRTTGACRIGRFGTLPFVDPTAPICACLRDEVLFATRCGGLGDVIFFDAHLPPVPPPGEIGLAKIQLHPWALDGALYRLTASVLEGEEERPAQVVGAKSGTFGLKDEKATIRFEAPETAATLRLRVEYLPAGEQEKRESWLDLLLEPEL